MGQTDKGLPDLPKPPIDLPTPPPTTLPDMSLLPALNLIKEFEGCKLIAYRDPVGVLTIGWGETNGVFEGMKITQGQADEMLINRVSKTAAQVRSMIETKMNNDQLCAFVSFAYNLGVNAFFHSTMLRKFNSGAAVLDTANEFRKWTHAGGKVLPGLVRRREAERNLFLSLSIPDLNLA